MKLKQLFLLVICALTGCIYTGGINSYTLYHNAAVKFDIDIENEAILDAISKNDSVKFNLYTSDSFKIISQILSINN